MPRKPEHTAQCWGGPEHGNVVSSSKRQWYYVQATDMFLDGMNQEPTKKTVRGIYYLDKASGRWFWKGPGADGDTLERIRKAD